MKRTYGYEAWVNHNKYYKLKLLSSLPPKLVDKFLLLLNSGLEAKATMILSKKLFNLFNLPHNIIKKYTNTELIKISSLESIISLSQITLILEYVDLQSITKHNIVDLYKYVSNIDKFKKGEVPISWGPGNNGCSHLNAVEHYKKHAKYNQNNIGTIYETEYLEWEKIIEDGELYSDYPITHFYKMRDVIVHTNGRGVYLSGFYGCVFIVGRYNGDTFGISSCYYVKSGRKLGREINKVFDIEL